MDKIRNLLDMALAWVDSAACVPVYYAAADSVPVSTRPNPLLELGFHLSGSESTVSVPGIEKRTTPGTLAVMNAHFGNQGVPADHWTFWCVSLRTDTCPDRGITQAPFLETVRLRHSAQVQAQFEEVGRQHQRTGPTRNYRLKADMLKLLLTLYEAAGYAGTEPIYSPACQQALEYIDGHLADPQLSLPDIARASCLSVAQMCRRFKADTGTSPMKYVTAQRLRRAGEMLQKTALNIGEVAAAVGFNDPLHFSRVFRHHAGTPPTVYRRQADLAAQNMTNDPEDTLTSAD